MAIACFIVGELLFLAQAFGGARIESLAIMAPGLVWLALFRATGNRELFFPYSMYLASCVALRAAERAAWLGPIGGGLVVGVFMVIRVLQQATLRVLAVEFAVAAAILAFVLVARSWRPRHGVPFGWEAAIVAASSLLAYASLVL